MTRLHKTLDKGQKRSVGATVPYWGDLLYSKKLSGGALEQHPYAPLGTIFKSSICQDSVRNSSSGGQGTLVLEQEGEISENCQFGLDATNGL